MFLSGTNVREKLKVGEKPPIEFSRPGVAEVLIEGIKEEVNIRIEFNYKVRISDIINLTIFAGKSFLEILGIVTILGYYT